MNNVSTRTVYSGGIHLTRTMLIKVPLMMEKILFVGMLPLQESVSDRAKVKDTTSTCPSVC